MKKLTGLDKTLIFIAIFDVLFVIAMIVLFYIFQSTPDILIGAVFGATFGECGCCSYIWKKKREKELEKEETNDRSNIEVNNNCTDDPSDISNNSLFKE